MNNLNAIDYLTTEVWKPMAEGKGLFISSFGRIYRMAKSIQRTHKGKIITQPVKAKFVIGKKLSVKGYQRFNHGQGVMFVHRLVAKYFLENPFNKPQINHKDGNKTNNRVDNLEWVTNQENRDHAVKSGLHVRGEDVGSAKLSESDVVAIRHLYSEGLDQYSLADRFGVCQQTISAILLGKTWKHIK